MIREDIDSLYLNFSEGWAELDGMIFGLEYDEETDEATLSRESDGERLTIKMSELEYVGRGN